MHATDGLFPLLPSNSHDPRHNFVKVKAIDGDRDWGMPYDYCSIMQYGPKTAAKMGKNGKALYTLVPKNLDYLYSMGQPQKDTAHITWSDATVVNEMYRVR